MNQRDKELYVDLVKRIAQQSRARRLKVGALLVNDGTIIYGYNGTPAGWDNNCEIEEIVEPELMAMSFTEDGISPMMRAKTKLVTKPEVIHAEMNVFKKVANNPGIIRGGTLFITHPPCPNCAKLFLSTGLNEVIYIEDYISTSSDTNQGLEFLARDGIKVTKWENANASL